MLVAVRLQAVSVHSLASQKLTYYMLQVSTHCTCAIDVCSRLSLETHESQSGYSWSAGFVHELQISDSGSKLFASQHVRTQSIEC